MFSLPMMNALPVPGLFGGTVVVPGLGAFLAAVVIAALVGSALGMLRQMTSPHGRGVTRQPTPLQPTVDHQDHHLHQEAA